MKEKLNTLLTKYPDVFVTTEDKWGGAFEGFQCNDGWFAIVHDFCMHLQSHNETTELYAKREWRKNNTLILTRFKGGPLIANGEEVTGNDTIEKRYPFNPPAKIKINCVKEKFGSLCVYCDGNDNTDDFTWGLIVMAEGMSHYFCEDCGTTHGVGKTHGVDSVGWIRNICKPCYEEWVKSGYGGGGSEPRKEAWAEKENPGDAPMIVSDLQSLENK